MTNSRMDALIIGAGPVGLTMAAAFRHWGLSCRIIDKAPAASDKSKALVVWSRTLELLDKLGLADRFVQTGMKIKGASIYNGNDRLAHISIADVASPFNFPLMIPQNETERLLKEHLEQNGITIERSVELMSFVERGDVVECVLRHADGREERVSTPWLIGCDGAHSTVRHTLGMPFTGQAEPNDWILADVHIRGPLATDEISVYWHEKGVVVFFPISPGRFRMVADIGTASDHGDLPPATLADAQARADERGPSGLTLSDPVWVAYFRINERKVSDYRRGRVVLAGDAAHIHSPAGGQGMNTGMQDAMNLAWKLALVERGQGLLEPLLDSYSTERSEVGDQVLHAAERMTSLATLRNWAAQYMRNHVVPIVSSFGFVQDKIRQEMSELAINYRHSSLSAADWAGRSEIKSGDRCPDAPLKFADGRTATLFAELRDTNYMLLLMPGDGDEEAVQDLVAMAAQVCQAFPGVISARLIRQPAGGGVAGAIKGEVSANVPVCEDVEGGIYEQFGVGQHSALILVRPDGYIGYRGQPADGEKIMGYLRRFLVQ